MYKKIRRKIWEKMKRLRFRSRDEQPPKQERHHLGNYTRGDETIEPNWIPAGLEALK